MDWEMPPAAAGFFTNESSCTDYIGYGGRAVKRGLARGMRDANPGPCHTYYLSRGGHRCEGQLSRHSGAMASRATCAPLHW